MVVELIPESVEPLDLAEIDSAESFRRLLFEGVEEIREALADLGKPPTGDRQPRDAPG